MLRRPPIYRPSVARRSIVSVPNPAIARIQRMVLDRPTVYELKIEHCLPFVERAYEKMAKSDSAGEALFIHHILTELNEKGREQYRCANRSEMARELAQFLRRHGIPACPIFEFPEGEEGEKGGIIAIDLSKYRD